MRRALTLVVIAGCEVADQDPAALLRARGPDAVDCGTADAWRDEPAAAWTRACALAARGRGQAFRALASGAVSDGADVTGWLGWPDGSGWRLRYSATYAMVPGLDTECVRWTPCARIVAGPPDCATLDDDLCLTCE